MYKLPPLLISFILLGCFTTTITSIAQAETLVVQNRSIELKQLLEQGRGLVDAGDYDGAIRLYQRAANIDPRNAKIESGIGYLYAKQGKFSSALAAYRRAIKLNPNNSDFYYAVGYIKGNSGDTFGAKEAYRKAIQLNRGNVDAYLGLGVTQTSLGDYQSAMWAYEQAISLNRSYPRTYELMGSLFKQRHQTRQASKTLQTALDLYRRTNDQDGIGRVQNLLQSLGG